MFDVGSSGFPNLYTERVEWSKFARFTRLPLEKF